MARLGFEDAPFYPKLQVNIHGVLRGSGQGSQAPLGGWEWFGGKDLAQFAISYSWVSVAKMYLL